jgi:L-alanine-DL-glutamate epimerase-like enolase superfamily enzyme
VWDAVAKIAGVPLYRLLAERLRGGTADTKVFAYAAGGYYYPGKDVSALQREMQGYLDLGYSVVKMKIGGAPLSEDLLRIEAVLKILKASDQLAVDANGRFDLDTAIAYARAFAPYGLRWYEEVGDPLDYDLHAKLTTHYAGPVATGESLFSLQDARNLIRYSGLRADRDILQFDCALSYGLVEYLRILLHVERIRLIPEALHSSRRPSNVFEHRGGIGTRRQRILSGTFSAFRRIRGWHSGRRQLRAPSGNSGHWVEAKSYLFRVMKALREA